MRFCLIDFETASSCDLKKAGAWRYAADPTTEILCLGYTDGKSTRVLTSAQLGPASDPDFAALVNNPDCMFVAHNAPFEKSIWRNIMVPDYGWPDIPNERWHDSMAVCAMKGLPLRLDHAAKLLGLASTKDMAGSRFTKSMSRTDRKGMMRREAAHIQRVVDYNITDLTTELELHRTVGGLGAAERRVWLLDQTINERGVRLDAGLIRASKRVLKDYIPKLEQQFRQITGGISTTQREKIMGWLAENGCDMPDLTAESVDFYCGLTEDSPVPVATGPVLNALRIRSRINSAAIKKLDAMIACADDDWIARYVLQYHGAGPGRWAGRLFQPQNFPRPAMKIDGVDAPDQENLIAALMTGDAEYVASMYSDPVECVSNALRNILVARPGNGFAVGDFATIEARIVLALAGQTDKVALLAGGQDIYINMAEAIYKVPVDKKKNPEKRQTGKNSVLGLGFQMGAAKFKLRYAPKETDEFCQGVVDTYRKEWAPLVPKLWYALERAAVDAVWERKPHEAFGVVYRLEDQWLTARLPSGRKLWYYGPRAVQKVMPWDENDVRKGVNYSCYKMGQMKTVSLYGGLLTENVVQALARDLLVAAMFRCEEAGYPIVLTVHDEIVSDLKNPCAKTLEALMTERPEWARELQIPVAAECWTGERYRK